MMQKANVQRVLVAAIVMTAINACERGKPAEKTPTGDTVATRPTPVAATAAAPDSFLVAFQTNKGRIVVQAVRAWAPKGVDRFYALVNDHFYDGVKFFRVLPDFMAQFGISGDPAKAKAWIDRNIPDDPVVQSNRRGFVTYATGGPDTRTTQLFINKRDNPRLDGMGFAPIGKVVAGMDAVDKLYMGYGEGAPGGNGPMQDRIQGEGNKYLNRYFPKLDSIVTARVVRSAKD
jgi:cyclophilin family peptidyl-prolyl cis-trans isomerase